MVDFGDELATVQDRIWADSMFNLYEGCSTIKGNGLVTQKVYIAQKSFCKHIKIRFKHFNLMQEKNENYEALLRMTSLKTSPNPLRLKKVDPDNPLLRFYTYMRHKLGDNGKKIIEDLHAVYGDSCVGKTAVCR